MADQGSPSVMQHVVSVESTSCEPINQLNVCTTSETEGVVVHLKPEFHYRSKAVVLLWFSVACFWCQSFGDVSPYVCSYYF